MYVYLAEEYSDPYEPPSTRNVWSTLTKARREVESWTGGASVGMTWEDDGTLTQEVRVSGREAYIVLGRVREMEIG